MSRIRRQYSREFKLEALRLWQTSSKSAAEIERDLGLTSGRQYRWKRALKEAGDDAFPGQGRQTGLEEEVRRLRGELKSRAGSVTFSRRLSASLPPPKRKFAFVKSREDRFPVQRLCQVMGDSTSGYYAWSEWPPSRRSVDIFTR